MATKKTTTKKVVLKKPVVRRSSQAASKKPIIGLGTLITIVVFAGVILFGLFLNRQQEKSAAEATPTKGTTFVFGQSDGTLSSIEVKPSEGETVKLVSDAKNTWAFELPAKVEADQGLVAAAASQVSALQVVTTLPANADPSVFGLDAPVYVITLGFGGKSRVLEIGSATPTNSGYYVRVDKGEIVIVDLGGIDALTQLVSSPPYLNTPTPTAIPATPTLVAPTVTPAPEASVTPTP